MIWQLVVTLICYLFIYLGYQFHLSSAFAATMLMINKDYHKYVALRSFHQWSNTSYTHAIAAAGNIMLMLTV